MSYRRLSFEEKCEIWGWVLFIVCALFFIAGGVINRDPLTVLGSLFFLIANFVFLAGLLSRIKKR